MWGNITTKKRLFEENKKYWNQEEDIIQDEGYICIAHLMTFHLEFNMLLDILAKGIQKKEKLPIFSFSVGENALAFDEGDQSFYIDGGYIDIEGYKTGQRYEDRKEFLETCVENSYGRKDEILKIKYRNIECGDALWDMLIMFSETFDCTKVKKDIYISVLNTAFSMIDMAFDLFEIHTPRYLVMDECARLESLIAGVAIYYGAKIVFPYLEWPDSSIFIKNNSTSMGGFFTQMMKQRFTQDIQNGIENYKQNFIYQLPDEINSNFAQIPVHNGNKNVFIMLHCLDDSPRMACTHEIYKDYTEWFLDTMEIIGRISDVNWIIRDHPHATGKKQREFVKKVYDKYKRKNIYWCEDNVKREQIANVADVIITYVGDVGLEYWALGIPTITLAEAYYVSFGISYCMKSREEYVSRLKYLDGIERPSEESIIIARNILNQINFMCSPKDEIADLFTQIRYKELKGIKYERRDYDLYDYEFIVKYIKLLDKVRTSSCYLLTNCLEIEIIRG